jgi:hypothetical protein
MRLCNSGVAQTALRCSPDSIGPMRECIRQIEAKALREREHSSRSRKLHSFFDS